MDAEFTLEKSPTDSHDRREQRRAPRVSAEISIDFVSEHNFYLGLTENVSDGGVFVVTYRAFSPGDKLTVCVALPGAEEPLVVETEVRWVRAASAEGEVPPGIGLAFVNLDAAARARVEAFVRCRDPIFFDD